MGSIPNVVMYCNDKGHNLHRLPFGNQLLFQTISVVHLSHCLLHKRRHCNNQYLPTQYARRISSINNPISHRMNQHPLKQHSRTVVYPLYIFTAGSSLTINTLFLVLLASYTSPHAMYTSLLTSILAMLLSIAIKVALSPSNECSLALNALSFSLISDCAPFNLEEREGMERREEGSGEERREMERRGGWRGGKGGMGGRTEQVRSSDHHFAT